MRTRRIAGATLMSILLAGGTAAAHHAFSAEFDADRPVILVGLVTKTEWINPHAWIWMDVKGPDGQVKNWGIELGPPNALLRRGWKRDSMPIGSEIKVDGYAAKSGKEIANAIDITLANGTTIFAGSSGSGAPREGRTPPPK
jgi:hypothetical protein